MNYRNFQQLELGLGDLLALDRTKLANERTFLAYVRAAIMMGVSAVSIIKLFPESPALLAVGWVILPLSILLIVIGSARFLRLRHVLGKLDRQPS